MRVQGSWNRGAKLVVSNHLSYLDGLIVAHISPIPLAFAIDTEFSRKAPWKWGLKALEKMGYGWSVPLDRRSPFGMRELFHHLAQDRAVCLFPHGRICLPDEQASILPGVASLSRRYDGRIQGIRFSRSIADSIWGKSGSRRVLPEISIQLKDFSELDEALTWISTTEDTN